MHNVASVVAGGEMRLNYFKNRPQHNFMKLKHILSTQQFLDKEMLVSIFRAAEKFEKEDKKGKIPQLLKGKILASVFYEPSTRTRFSFEAAMLKLGGGVISTESAGHFSSAIKGETLEDTIRVIGGYADVIVLRHPEIGAARRAAEISPVPVINAGDGEGEHPTQALLDLYTIKKELRSLDNFKIALTGDLRYGRTIHSLILLLSLSRGIEMFLISPQELRLPKEYRTFLKKQKIYFSEHNSLKNILPETDILYVTRVQKERFSSPRLYDKVKNSFIVGSNALKLLKKTAIIMDPLPRVKKIAPEIDSDPRAAYFRQAQNGLYIRMALLASLFRN